jgi:hypothetical protein
MTAVDSVSREVGYEDTASFRRLFRRLAGMGPADYRRKFQVPSFIGRIEKASSTPKATLRVRPTRPASKPGDISPRRRSGNPPLA